MNNSTKPSLPPMNNIAKAIECFNAGKKAQAFNIIGAMKIKTALTKEEHKTFAVAADFLNGNGRLWTQMKWVESETVAKAEALFVEKFMKEDK
jgi:hypothetical protein